MLYHYYYYFCFKILVLGTFQFIFDILISGYLNWCFHLISELFILTLFFQISSIIYQLVEHDSEGQCGSECKTIERACQEVWHFFTALGSEMQILIKFTFVMNTLLPCITQISDILSAFNIL